MENVEIRRRIRERAAEIIEEKGWWQGGYRGPGGEVCMLQALLMAEEEEVERPVWVPWVGFSSSGFNDAAGRTKEEVIGLLRDPTR